MCITTLTIALQRHILLLIFLMHFPRLLFFLGVCHHTSDSEFECECREGFQGSHCQSPVPCDMSTRCLNGGTCIEPEQGSGDVVCLCPHGYLGMYQPSPPPPPPPP